MYTETHLNYKHNKNNYTCRYKNKKNEIKMLVIIKMADCDSVKWYLPYVYGNVNVNEN